MITDAWHYRIKAAQRDLIARAGGIERAAKLTSLSTSQVGRLNNPRDTDVMPIHVALALEAEAGEPLVTAAMASLHGRRLAEPDGLVAAETAVLSRYGEVMRQAGELMAAGASAFADGRLTPAEAHVIDRSCSTIEAGLSDLRKALAGARATGGVRLVGEGR